MNHCIFGYRNVFSLGHAGLPVAGVPADSKPDRKPETCTLVVPDKYTLANSIT